MGKKKKAAFSDQALGRTLLFVVGAACIGLMLVVFWFIAFLATENEGRFAQFPLFWILVLLLGPVGITYGTWGILAVAVSFTRRGGEVRRILMKDKWKTKKKKLPVHRLWSVVYDIYLVIQLRRKDH